MSQRVKEPLTAAQLLYKFRSTVAQNIMSVECSYILITGSEFPSFTAAWCDSE